MNSLNLPKAANLDNPPESEKATSAPSPSDPLAEFNEVISAEVRKMQTPAQVLANKLMADARMMNSKSIEECEKVIQAIQANTNEVIAANDALVKEVEDHIAFLRSEDTRLGEVLVDHLNFTHAGLKVNEIISGAFKEMRESFTPRKEVPNERKG